MPNTAAAIEVRGVEKRFDGVAALAGVDLAVAPGSIVALLGPSGCGKTTLLRAIAGLERADAGEIFVSGTRVEGSGVHVAPERRRVGMVFQDWALFPHLSVGANVGYGLPRAERRGPRVDDALAMVGLAGMHDRNPSTLSGGQQQRVALARALAPRPSVLLLDEPFSNLDTALRVQVRAEVHHLLAELGITTVFVTHDQEEAFVLGDEVAVMNAGEIVHAATPAELYDRPATRWVAAFVGEANLLPGHAAGDTAATVLGSVALREHAEGEVEVLLRPEQLRVSPGSSATVELVEYFGHDTIYVIALDRGGSVRARASAAPRHRRGDRVDVAYEGSPAVVYPRRSAPVTPAPVSTSP